MFWRGSSYFRFLENASDMTGTDLLHVLHVLLSLSGITIWALERRQWGRPESLRQLRAWAVVGHHICAVLYVASLIFNRFLGS